MDFAAFRAWWSRRPQLADAVLGLALLALPTTAALVGLGHGKFQAVGPWDLVAVAVAFLLVTFRRRWPMQVLLLVTGASAAFIVASGDQHPAMAVAWVLVGFTFAGATDRRGTWLVGGSCIVALYAFAALFGDAGWFAPQSVGASAWAVAGLALGDAKRSRRDFVAAIEARADRAERTREEEARRRVAEERLRIARELHDVVAHHIAVINVQAGAAAHVLGSRPEAAGPALAHIRTASDTAMKELASVVGLLRSPVESEGTEPTRGLERLAGLIDTLAASGLQVEHRQRGTARELPAVVDLAAFRIVQESLTNAHKHGTGKARLTVSFMPEAVVIDVDNTVAGATGEGTGYGLVGMHERASAAGGTVSAGTRPDGRFSVHAELPAPAEVTA